MASEFDVGMLIGLLISEAHFGGDGRQPHITVKMHVRHGALFDWLDRTFPGGRRYGPYHHDGRNYYQWMARGSYLVNDLAPLIDRHLTASLDVYARERFDQMLRRYPRHFGSKPIERDDRPAAPPPDRGAPDATALFRLLRAPDDGSTSED
jgi:hypothetical protein